MNIIMIRMLITCIKLGESALHVLNNAGGLHAAADNMLVEAIGLLLTKNCALCQHCLSLVVTGWWLESALVQQIILFLVQFQFSLDFKISIGPTIYFLIMLSLAKSSIKHVYS